ncbi:MAG: thiamine-phosphate kinase [Verrucomicrobiota bacterium]|nr:thiamine-phosphate kinase [Verrucomicrobiota bacterium]
MIFTQSYEDSIACLGERKLLSNIQKWLGPCTPPAPHGIGDDCAVLDPFFPGKPLLTTDSLTFGIHFDSNISAKDAGAKLIKRNLSDIAAMAGTPSSAVLALLCGPDVSTMWLQEFFEGVRSACLDYTVSLVGGDVSQVKKGAFSAVLTLTGTASVPILRQTAQQNDQIYVTGSLGGSALGKHYAFLPRLVEARWLSKQSECSAMMDLTDGLGKDLSILCPDKCAAKIDLDAIPIASSAHKIAKVSKRKALEHAMCDGEDYELLFSITGSSDRSKFESRWAEAFPDLSLTNIGVFVVDSRTSKLLDTNTNKILSINSGFEHFKQP